MITLWVLNIHKIFKVNKLYFIKNACDTFSTQQEQITIICRTNEKYCLINSTRFLGSFMCATVHHIQLKLLATWISIAIGNSHITNSEKCNIGI